MSRIKAIESRAQNETNSRNGPNRISKRREHFISKEDEEKQQISELLLKLPKLDRIFEVHRKIGEGTFSSVYLGSLRQHSQLTDAEKQWFAIKHLVPTAHPARIEHELKCLQEIGGKEHVIGVELCLRQFDTIVFIMPYIPHQKFVEYVSDMDSIELRQYLRALLVALRHVHSFGVIHRDIKPSNFLYDRENRRYLLVDFGLAQRIMPGPPPSSACGTKRLRNQEESIPAAKRIALDLSARSQNGRIKSETGSSTDFKQSMPMQKTLPKPRYMGSLSSGAMTDVTCRCAGAAGVCTGCAARGAARAARAGTQGFRPPEVLLKCVHQTTAVDMWAAGVVLASLLSRRYPFFRASDDASALAELADLVGTERLQQTAVALGRRVVMSSTRPGLCLRKLCERLRNSKLAAPPTEALCTSPCTGCRLPLPQCLCPDHTKPPHEFIAGKRVAGFPDSVFALAAQLLEPLPSRRISAADALNHPFFSEDD